MVTVFSLRVVRYLLFLTLALVLGLLAISHRQPVHGARSRPRATAAPVVVRKSAQANDRPKTVRPVPLEHQP